MRKLGFITGLVAILFVAPVNGSDCFVLTSDFPHAFEKAKAVFIGEVTEIRPVSSDPNAPLVERWYRVSFKVEYSWKGAGFQSLGAPGIVVLSNQGRSGDCYSWGSFTVGRKYLVYADENAHKDLVVRAGNRTSFLPNASDDLKELQRMSSPFYGFRVDRHHL